MRSRLERGKLHKAERGELFVGAPLGYVRLPSGELDLDPDEQVRGGVRMIFSTGSKNWAASGPSSAA